MNWKHEVALMMNTKDDSILRIRPFGLEYVDVYTQWMQIPDLRQLTCTPDDAMNNYDQVNDTQQELWNDSSCLVMIMEVVTDRSTTPIGDVSVFMHEWMGDGNQAEIDVMIANPEFRGKGIAQDAVLAVLQYTLAVRSNLTTVVAKINSSNVFSIKLFQDKLGFALKADNEAFDQKEYEQRAESLKAQFSNQCIVVMNESLQGMDPEQARAIINESNFEESISKIKLEL
jgi:RimJ/RimL family protein N-acetyltransferase